MSKIIFEENKDITNFLTMRLPVRVRLYCRAHNAEEIVVAVQEAKRLNTKIFFLGGGSNIATYQDYLDGMVIHNFYKDFKVEQDQGDHSMIRVSSGLIMGHLIRETIKLGLSGFEYHMGIPGTVGGAICMNAKWTRPITYVGDNLLSARLINLNGEVREVDRDYFNFAYDYSKLQETQEIVLDAKFRLSKLDKSELERRAREAITYRTQTQPVGTATCGCFFQNISEIERKQAGVPYLSTGYLIDQAGLKNYQAGDMTVSDKHGSFLVNTGQATGQDLKNLVFHIKNKVQDKFDVKIREEVVLW